jgi:1-acyl-sn-glycerol-3-phosphate acyltransferase
MRYLVLYARLGRIILHLLLGVSIVLLLYPFLSLERRHAIVRWWSHRVLSLCGTALVVKGGLPTGPRIFVMNHISWLDIYALNALKPSHFVAKSEIRGWPLIGLLCDRAGTIFIERGKRHAVHQVIHQLAERMKQGHTSAVFAEGTTTRGDQLLPFHANLLQAAVQAHVPVTPVALRYWHHEQRSEVPAYVDGMSLVESMSKVVMTPGMVAELCLLPELHREEFKTRHALAKAAQNAISAHLGVSVAGATPVRSGSIGRENATLL